MWHSGIIAFVSVDPVHFRVDWLPDHVQNHSASYGFAPHRRHAVRVACHAERPVFDPAGKSQEEELNSRDGLPNVNKDGARQSNYND